MLISILLRILKHWLWIAIMMLFSFISFQAHTNPSDVNVNHQRPVQKNQLADANQKQSPLNVEQKSSTRTCTSFLVENHPSASFHSDLSPYDRTYKIDTSKARAELLKSSSDIPVSQPLKDTSDLKDPPLNMLAFQTPLVGNQHHCGYIGGKDVNKECQ